jgi:ribosomal protein S19E (S16A)
VGKTWFALEMMRAIITGGKFLGKFQAQSGAVVLVGQDSSIYDYARQVRKLYHKDYAEEKIRGETGEENAFDTCFHALIQPGLALGDSKSVSKLVDYANGIKHTPTPQPIIRWEEDSYGNMVSVVTDWEFTSEMGASLIVIDTQASTTEGIQENDASSMGVVYRNLRYLSDSTNATVLIIHHNSNTTEFGAERWRGSTAQWGALDNWYQLRNIKGPDDRYTTRVVCQTKKIRGIRPSSFSYLLHADEKVASLTFEKFYKEEAHKEETTIPPSEGWDALAPAVKAYLTGATKAQSMKEIMAGVKGRMGPLGLKPTLLRDKVRKVLQDLENSGNIHITDGGYKISHEAPKETPA